MTISDNFVEEYLINPSTMVIQPYIYEGKIYSAIHELSGIVYYCDMKPFNLIKKNCKYYGTSYEGLRSGTKHLINVTHKSPIAINPLTSIFFFPTTSPVNNDCIWIASNLVTEYYEASSGYTMVEFENKKVMEIPVSEYIFNRQIQKTANLELKLHRNYKRSLEYKAKTNRTIHMNASELKRPYRID